MSCAPIDRLMQTLRVNVPGATDAMIELALYNTVDEFFRRTSAWRYPQDIILVEGNYEYPMNLPSDTMVVRVMQMQHQGMPVGSAPVSGESGGGQTITSVGALVPELIFPDGDPSYKPATISGPPSGLFAYAIYRPAYLSIIGQPDDEARKFPLQAVFALTLAPTCIECACDDWPLEEWMYDTYFGDFVDGTMGRMLSMINKPWSNTTLAAYHHRRFRNEMAFRKQEATRGFVWDKPMWRFPGTWTR